MRKSMRVIHPVKRGHAKLQELQLQLQLQLQAHWYNDNVDAPLRLLPLLLLSILLELLQQRLIDKTLSSSDKRAGKVGRNASKGTLVLQSVCRGMHMLNRQSILFIDPQQ